MSSTAFDYLTASLRGNKWARRWLMLSVLSLALAGIFAVILVVSRTPQLIRAVPVLGEFFEFSLVIHVDLSVLVWFLAFTGMLWSILRGYARSPSLPFFTESSWFCMLAGMVLIAVSPFSGEWEVIKSNYIPVMTNMVFFMGLALVMASLIIGIIQTIPAIPVTDELLKQEGQLDLRLIGWGSYGSVIITAIALGAFAASDALMPATITGEDYYEVVFWAGGHILQFTYGQIMLVAWCLMASMLGFLLPPRPVLAVLFILGPFFCAMSFIPYIAVELMDPLHKEFFTLQMNVAAGIGGGVLGLYLLFDMLSGGGFTETSEILEPSPFEKRKRELVIALVIVTGFLLYGMLALPSIPFIQLFALIVLITGFLWLWVLGKTISVVRDYAAIKGCLLMSMILFAFGGLFGSVINGPNVRIPAHYHGSTVAVTLALMGLAYALLPKLGGRAVAHWRMARWQPYILGVGQLIHITGLAWSGGYGVIRKTVGHMGDGSEEVKIALGMLGGGGLLAIIGGLLFVIVMLRGFKPAKA